MFLIIIIICTKSSLFEKFSFYLLNFHFFLYVFNIIIIIRKYQWYDKKVLVNFSLKSKDDDMFMTRTRAL